MNRMQDFLSRTISMLGDDAVEKLKNSHVLVFGLGGVGGHAVEALCRAGIGTLSLVDSECYEISNLNRQIFATADTIGEKKTEAAKKRILSINPGCKVLTYPIFYGKDPAPNNLFDGVDYILDAIDSTSAKLDLIRTAKEKNIPIICSMGTGNKLDPTAFRVTDINKTKVCPLARVIRRECKKIGVEKLKVVYSEEEPVKTQLFEDENRVPASVSFVPGVAGMILAGEIIKDLIK